MHITAYANELPFWLLYLDRKWWNLRESQSLRLLVFGINRIISKVFLKCTPKINTEKFLNSNFLGLRVNQLDSMTWQLRKLLEVYNHIQIYDFDYVYFVNSSSYVRIEALKSFCDSLGKKDIYGGSISATGGITYISGSSKLLSVGVLKKIICSRSMFDLWRYEDVEMGKVASFNEIKPTLIRSTVIASLSELKNLTNEELTKNFHLRVKSEANSIRQDSQIMQEIEARLKIVQTKL